MNKLNQIFQIEQLNEVSNNFDFQFSSYLNLKNSFLKCTDLLNSSHALCIYISNNKLIFKLVKGFFDDEVNSNNLTLSTIHKIFLNKLKLDKSNDLLNTLDQLFLKKILLSDWIINPLYTLNQKQVGLMFLGRTDQKKYLPTDHIIIDNLTIQLAHRLEILKLTEDTENLKKINSLFLSNISHEIRTPLNAISGFAEILTLSENHQDRFKMNESIKKNTDQLTQIFDNILEISKIETNQIEIKKEPILLSIVIETIHDMIKTKTSQKHCFNLTVSDEVPQCLEIDIYRLKQILINLIDNAVKFSKNKEIQIELEYFHSSSEFSIKITDKGIGISQETQLELFKNFSQLDSSNTRNYGGIGLGLSLSQRLAQQMNGQIILLESQIDQGSTFQLKIQSEQLDQICCLDCLPNQNQNMTQSTIQLDQKSVLLVEDSIDNQEIFDFYLKSAGLLIEIVDNGEDAVKLAAQHQFDFILMDIQLPKMDGLEATRIIRDLGYSKPIIALTAHASIEEKINCLKAGCTNLITKPVSQITLIKQIQNILEAQ